MSFQLQYVRRDLGYIDRMVADGVPLASGQMRMLATIRALYSQQKYMYDSRTHTVKDRIVSISQPYIRPIVRGKTTAPVEFGAKLDLSIDETGLARIERLSFDAYNESEVLPVAVERYRMRTGHYPERILADRIYRNRVNLSYCSRCGIRLMGPRLGRPKRNPSPEQRKQEYIDNADRIEVERAFSLAKRRYGMGRIVTKLEETTKHAIAMSIIAMNVDRIVSASFCLISVSVISRFRLYINRIISWSLQPIPEN